MDEVERPTGKNYKNYVLVQFMFISMNVWLTKCICHEFQSFEFSLSYFYFLGNGNARRSHDERPKEQISVHLARALEKAENLFSTPKAQKIRKKTHIEIKRDNKGNRIFHRPRKGIK